LNFFSQPRSDASAVVYDGKIYIIGGFTGGEVLRSIEVYDPLRDEWSFGPTMNVPRSGLKVSSVLGL
jgi:kelch-like protein 10